MADLLIFVQKSLAKLSREHQILLLLLYQLVDIGRNRGVWLADGDHLLGDITVQLVSNREISVVSKLLEQHDVIQCEVNQII